MRRLYRVVAALLIPTASLATALVAIAGLVLTIGESPSRALLTLLRGALGDPEGIGYTLFYAIDSLPGSPWRCLFRPVSSTSAAKARPRSGAWAQH